MTYRWRVEVECQRCGEEYTSRAIEKRRPPRRCKFCKSSKLRTNHDKDKVFTLVDPAKTKTVDNGGEN